MSEEILEDDRYHIWKMDECYADMLYDLRNGKEKGTTTHLGHAVDQAWKWRKGEANIWTGYANEGKAVHIETYIPTPNGLVFMRDIQVGDQVFDEEGKICNVTNVTPIMYDRDCYKITFSDGAWLVADGNHQWVVDDQQSRGSYQRIQKRGELKKRGRDQKNIALKQSTLTTRDMVGAVTKNGKCNYSIRLTGPVEYPKKELPVDPYLMGAWLGDGSKEGGQITSADDEILEQFRIKGYTITKHSAKYSYGILRFVAGLRKAGVVRNKHIPDDYIRSDVEDRLALLQGLMDTDGHCDKLGRCEYTCVTWHLAQHFQQLAESLGIKVYFTEDIAKLDGRIIGPNYRFRFKTEMPVFRLRRKLERQSKGKNDCRLIESIVKVDSVPVKCIEVDSPNHMYLCTEHFIPTHNSLFLRHLCIVKAVMEDWKFVFCAPEDYPAKEFYDDMLHTLTGFTTDKDSPYRVTEEFYEKAKNKIKDNFFFLYAEPPMNTIKGVLEQFKTLCNSTHIDACIIDPLLKFARPKGFSERDDLYAGYIGSICVDFCRMTNTSFHLVMHQVTPIIDTVTKKYPEPSMYRVKGGGSWADGFDNVLSVWRPEYAIDKTDTQVWFGSQKIKKQKLVGIPQRIKMRFDRRSNRYTDYITNKDLFNFNNVIYDVSKE